MTQYEVTIIVDPVLSGDESKSTAQTYQDMLTEKGGSIVNVDNIGLRSLAYPINKRTTGVYYCVEFQAPGVVVDDLELALRRDERIMRFLTVKLDKYGVQYNADKRAGKIGRKKEKVSEEIKDAVSNADTIAATKPKPAPFAPGSLDTGMKITPKVKADAASTGDAQDLTRVEGIGPKINELLHAGGITTFAKLASADVASIKAILDEAGGTYTTKDPSTWGQQAQLVVDGKDDELKELQDRLNGGKEVA